MAKSLTVKEFFSKFPDDDTCILHVMDLRYGRVRNCLGCGQPTEYYKLAKRPAFSCKLCGHHIYPCAGTPFERTRTPLQLWFYAIYLFTTSRHGVPAKELQRQLGVTYKTAWRIGHEIRKFMGKVDGDDGLSGTVEIDEAYVGGNDHKTGRPGKDSSKTAIFGMVERGGDVMTQVVPNVRMETLAPIIEQNIEKGTLINSDEYMGYRTLNGLGYKHSTVQHRRKQYVNGATHTNTIEGFWSHFKCSMKGTHRSISRKHMQKYLVEFEFRFNLRGSQAPTMFDRLIQSF
jgi:transposase-like protein